MTRQASASGHGPATLPETVSGRPGRGRNVGTLLPSLLILGILTLLALAPASAIAGIVRPYEGFIASNASIGKVAVDHDTGDVYVVGPSKSGLAVISRYTGTGAPDNFTSGPDAGTNTLTDLASEPEM